LFYSAAGYAHDVQKAIRAGAQAYLVKPVGLDMFEQVVAQLVSLSGETAIEARRAEIDAIREELAIRTMENAQRLEVAKRKHSRAKEKLLRVKAEVAFLAAGGTRGDFARWWPSVYLEEVRLRSDDT
jgi:DNA-binding NarL/FixJ family response regulator